MRHYVLSMCLAVGVYGCSAGYENAALVAHDGGALVDSSTPTETGGHAEASADASTDGGDASLGADTSTDPDCAVSCNVGADASDATSEALGEAAPDASAMDAQVEAEAGAPTDSSLPSCGGVCVSPAPIGWTGPFATWSGSPASPPTCTGAWAGQAVSGFDGLNASPATCSCTCDPATGQSCAPLVVNVFFEDAQCSGAYACGTTTLTTGCQPLGASCGASYTAYYETSSPTPPTGGQCGTPQTTTSVPPPSWTTETLLCAYSGTSSASGCATGDTCVDAPLAPFGPLCIYTSGSTTCPSGPYGVQHEDFQGIDDSRGCSSCGCSGPNGGSCTGGGGVLWSGTTSCFNGSQKSMGASAACSSAGFSGVGSVQGSLPTLTPGTCTASGGLPAGTASPSQPITVCCTQ